MRRMFRRRQKQVEAATQLAETHFDDNFIGRIERLLDVQRFVIGWLFLVVLITILTIFQTVGLNQYYLKLGPVPGGVYNEGMVGTFSNANPIYATGAVDTSLSRLIFAGLFKYDDSDQLVGDLAKGYSLDDTGRVYTVHLKNKLTWHDGKPLTSHDVVFTYNLIKNPDTRSPLFTSWQGIEVSAPDEQTVVFRLPNALTAFPYSLTNGIVPQHILDSVPVSQLRASSFNTTKPVGAGPFAWDALQLGNSVKPGSNNASVSLKAFSGYNGGEPKLKGFVLHVYDNDERVIKAYKQRNIEAIAGLKNVPEELHNDSSTVVHNFPPTAETMVFFKTNVPILSDVQVRRALVYGADRTAVLSALGYSVRPVRSPLLIGQLAYDKTYEQPVYDPTTANQILDKAGWIRGKDGVRVKDGQRLQFQVLAEDNHDDRVALRTLQISWRGIGVVMLPALQQTSDFQSSVETHSYSALLYGISVGQDPDVFVYWDSSQADIRSSNRLNFSEYKSTAADTSLESGRTRQDPLIRAVKYKGFLKAWQEDAPALGLYQPTTLYLTRGRVAGLKDHLINTDADRYYSVNEWAVKTGNIPKS